MTLLTSKIKTGTLLMSKIEVERKATPLTSKGERDATDAQSEIKKRKGLLANKLK